jgi:photosystem II stability/assembly factor-like uncharacterized protein
VRPFNYRYGLKAGGHREKQTVRNRRSRSGCGDFVGGFVVPDGQRANIKYQISKNGFSRSDDGGDTWISVSTPVSGGALIDAAFTHPTLSGTVYLATSAYLWKSSDRGQNWVDWTHNLTDTAEASAMAFHPTNPLTMYLGTGRGNVFRSSNGGLSWELIGQPDTCIQHLAVNPFGAHELWATGSRGCSGYLGKYDSGSWARVLPGEDVGVHHI